MRAILALAFVLLAAIVPLAPARAASGSMEKSPGGLDYVRIHMPDTDKVSIRIAWPSDWAARADANHSAPRVGALLMLTGGAEGMPPDEVMEKLYDLGVEPNLWVEAQAVKGAIDMDRASLDEAVQIINAHLRAPAFSQRWFDRAREELAAQAAEYRALPDRMVLEALGWATLGDVPLRRFLAWDDPDRIKAVQLPEIKAWHQSVFTRGAARIVVAGNLDAAAAGKAVDALFAGLAEAAVLAPITPVADMRPRRILLHVPQAEASKLFVIGGLPSIAQGWKPEDELLVAELDKKLLNVARYELRAAYNMRRGITHDSDLNRFFAIEGDVTVDKLADAERLFRAAYAAFRDAGGPAGLDAVKSEILETLKSEVSEPPGAAQMVMVALETGRDMSMATDPAAYVAAISPQAVKARLAQAFPKPEEITFMAVSPNADALPGACIITAPEQAVNCK